MFGFILRVFLADVYVTDLFQSFDSMWCFGISLHALRFGGEMLEEETLEVQEPLGPP